MDEMSRAVLAAADTWFAAMQAVTAADEAFRRSREEQVELDAAEVELAGAIMAWRDRRSALNRAIQFSN
jgi:hypothetical protein